jgi:hypothetical protein
MISLHAFNHSVRTTTLRYSVLTSRMLPASQTFPIRILYSESNYSMKQIDNLLVRSLFNYALPAANVVCLQRSSW